MTIGYSAAGHCWATQSEAVDAYYSAFVPVSGAVWDSASSVVLTVRIYPSVLSGPSWNINRTVCNETYNSCSTKISAAPTNVVGSCTLSESSGGGSVPTGLPADFDYTILGALFAFSFSVVVGLWLFGRSAGSIVNIFKPK